MGGRTPLRGAVTALDDPRIGVPRIGVLALQGAFSEHVQAVEALEAIGREVRLAEDLQGVDGLIIPGGESTTMGRLIVEFGLLEPLREFSKRRPVMGTCAGMVMLGSGTTGNPQTLLGTMDMTVRRNAFGRQVSSFESDVEVDLSGFGMGAREVVRGVFIRAPWVEDRGPEVEVLGSLEGRAVAVRQGNSLALAFHPELTEDRKMHRCFVGLVSEAKKAREGFGVDKKVQEV